MTISMRGTGKFQELEKTEALTASEAILKYGLNWKVKEVQLKGDFKDNTTYKGIVREDTNELLHVAKQRYEMVQCHEAFQFFDAITQSGQAKYVQGGSYDGGRVFWLRARVPFDFDVLPGDKVQTYLRLVSSHDGSERLSIFPEVYRIVCQNGLHVWEKDNLKTVTAKHTASVASTFVFNGKQVLKDEALYFQRFQEKCLQLTKKHMSELEINVFLNELLGISEVNDENSTRSMNKKHEIWRLTANGMGTDIKGVKNTAYGVYNAVTEYIDHYASVKGEDKDTAREQSSFMGGNANLREKAFALLTR